MQNRLTTGMRLLLVVTWCCVSLGLPSQPAAAQTTIYRVATTGTDTAGCGTEVLPCRTIQYVLNLPALFQATATILLAAGTYNNPTACLTTGTAVVCVLNQNITLLGGYTTSNWSGANPTLNTTVIDGQNSGRAVRVQTTGATEPHASLRLEGVTVQNGLAQGASSGSDTDTYAFGGGLLAEHATLVLRNVIFKNNRAIGGSTAQSYGGVGSGGGLAANATDWSMGFATATLENVTFDGNQSIGGTGAVRGGAAHGGALFTYSTTLTGNGVTFINNTATGGNTNGGGVFNNERADGLGGAVSVEIYSNVSLQNVTAMTNTATGGNAVNGEGAGAFGGAFFVELASLSLTNGYLYNNKAQGGNGLNTTFSSSLAEGGGVQADRSTLVLDRVRVINNTAQSGNGTNQGGAVGGGGVAITFNYSPTFSVVRPFTITNSVIANNRALIGSGALVGGGAGGLWVQGSTGLITHATIAGNQVSNNLLGQGLTLVTAAQWQTNVTMQNSILADHSTASGGAGQAALYVQNGTTASLTRTLFANNLSNTANQGSGTLTNTNPLSAGSAGFMASAAPNYNYHLRPTSAAVDQASGSTTTVDLDGQTRPSNGVADIGADEAAPFTLSATGLPNTLLLGWSSASGIVAGAVTRYDVVVVCTGGGAAPTGYACGVPEDVGTVTATTLSGLTNLVTYTITVNAYDGATLIASSQTVATIATDRVNFLPQILR